MRFPTQIRSGAVGTAVWQVMSNIPSSNEHSFRQQTLGFVAPVGIKSGPSFSSPSWSFLFHAISLYFVCASDSITTRISDIIRRLRTGVLLSLLCLLPQQFPTKRINTSALLQQKISIIQRILRFLFKFYLVTDRPHKNNAKYLKL